MRRQMNFNIKVGAAILVFSLMITVMFTVTMFWFGISANKVETDNLGLYWLSSTDYAEIIENSGTLQINPEKLIRTSDYQTSLLKQMYRSLFPVSLIFLVIMIVISICFWSILKTIQNRRMLRIAEQLNTFDIEAQGTAEPPLLKAYENLKQKFEGQLDEYKRLHSYLSHEQKNAVAILRTNLELTENTEYLQNLDDIADGIDDILTLSENTDSSQVVTVDVALICAEVYDNYRKVANNIAFEFDGDDDTEIIAKSRWIYRAVANLLDNAIKYGEEKPITLSVQGKNESVIVTVRDNGIGISEEKQNSIFQEHYRINELNKDGYGIGLSLVSHVCDLCGGFVMVESEPQKGSAFYLSFPQKVC